MVSVFYLNNGDLLDKMEIFVVRHGQTDLNKGHIAQGRNGLPLSEIKMTGTVPDMNAYSGVEELDHYKKRIVSFITKRISVLLTKRKK